MIHRFPILPLFAATLLAPGACASDGAPGEQDELLALLQDDPLTSVPPGTTDARAPAAGASLLPPGTAVGMWDFDDCTPSRTNLEDVSFSGNTAFRSVGAACTAGVQGKGVAIAAREDIVYVPDQPNFTFEDGVTVAGWFNPTRVDGMRSLLRKRDSGTSSFALLLGDGTYRFVISLGGRRAAAVSAPQSAKPGAFQHVAGTYDGATLRLYLDGVEVAREDVEGTIPVGPGPLLMGNDGSERRFDGAIDGTLFATHALSAAEVQSLTCLPVRPTMTVTPSGIPAALPGVPVAIDVALANRNPAQCAPIRFRVRDSFVGTGLTLDPPPFQSVETAPVASGATEHFTITATVSEAAEPGQTFSVRVFADEPTTRFFDTALISVTVGSLTGCHVSTLRELMIKDLSVVDDPVRTAFDPASTDPRNGVWTFKHLVESMAPTPADAPAMVAAMLASFTTPQTINGFTVAARPGMQSRVLDSWPRTADGALDLARAPLRLQAIVNRIDLRDLANGDAGEGRFVFAFEDPSGFALQATLILEYKLPAATEQDVLGWAQAFHALSPLPSGEVYNAALQAITERFAGRGARPGRPNGSAISTVRTNEIDFGDFAPWEMREFHLSPASGRLEPAPLALTPARGFDASTTLASYLTSNQTAILAERHTVPLSFDDQPFQAGAVLNNLETWLAPGVDNEVRHHFSVNTCNGCHSLQDTGTFFLQILPRGQFSEASLSGFLTGTTVLDPVTQEPRTFNDLARRKADLEAIVCAAPAALSGASATSTTLRKGISRVH